ICKRARSEYSGESQRNSSRRSVMNAEPVFSHRLRLRVSGLLVENDAVLLTRMRSPVTNEMVWIPPGGEVEFGEPMADALRREFLEETQVEVNVHRLLHIQELIDYPFH